jgi:tRNA-uridine 2-sulfurtransferase
MSPGSKAVVAMSGGVDSSVAAALLLDEGHDVTGLFLDTGVEGESAAPAPTTDGAKVTALDQVRRVGAKLGIHVEVLERQDAFEQQVIRPFADEYARARTPNPCVLCNQRFKFAALTEYADAVGAEIVATGHYARVLNRPGGPVLARGTDRQKDQSYYLFRIGRDLLGRLRLPLGEMTKDQSRAAARERDLPIHDRPESQDVCFASRYPYVELVRRYHANALQPGEVRDVEGRVVGHHSGLANYTIGQRKGLGIALGRPMYVTAIDLTENVVTLGPREALMQRRLVAHGAVWLVDPPAETFQADAQIRYRHREARATVTLKEDDRVEVVFDKPQWAITPGQAVVFFDGQVVLGGAWIDAGFDARRE